MEQPSQSKKFNLDNLAKAMFKEFEKNKRRYGHCSNWEEVAFWHTLKNMTQEFYIEQEISREVLEHTDDKYLGHIEERNGYEIGKAINANPDVYYQTEQQGFLGRRLRKCCVLFRLGALNEYDEQC